MKKILSFILALCMICTLLPATVFTASAADGAWTLVTNAADLAAGDKVVIVASSADYAMSVTQASNNRSAVKVTKNTTNKTVSIGDSVQQFTLETGSVAGTFAFNTGGGYIYCASTSSKNYLRTQSSKDDKASWAISITSAGVATVTSKVSGISRNLLQYNSSSTIFACYSSGQQAVSIYKWIEATTEPDVPTCEHTNKVAIGVAKDATCTEDGITAGVKCADCGEEITAQETIKATGHKYVDGFCSVCKKEQPKAFTLVTNASDLNVGDQIVIVAKDSAFALSTTQNNNNRGQATVTKKDDGTLEELNDSVQVLTLEAGKTSGTFAFNTGSGYLYAASSSANHLKTQTTLDANGSWSVSIASNGTATIIAQGSYSRNVMQYNQSSSLFACYGSASQKAISIYKQPSAAPVEEPVLKHVYVAGAETVIDEYTSWDAALNEATTGTITLLKDVTADVVGPRQNVVLDLNGFTLTANRVAADCVMDSSDGTGLIKVGREDAVLKTQLDSQLILWDNANQGYRVYDYDFLERGVDAKRTDDAQTSISGGLVKSFWSDLDFSNKDAYLKFATSGLQIGFTLEWAGASEPFWMDSTTAGKWSSEKYADDLTDPEEPCFYITVTGFANLNEDGVLKATPVIMDCFGNIIEANNSITYTYTCPVE